MHAWQFALILKLRVAIGQKTRRYLDRLIGVNHGKTLWLGA